METAHSKDVEMAIQYRRVYTSASVQRKHVSVRLGGQVRKLHTSLPTESFLTLKEVLYSSKSKPSTTVNKQKITYFVGLSSANRRIQ